VKVNWQGGTRAAHTFFWRRPLKAKNDHLNLTEIAKALSHPLLCPVRGDSVVSGSVLLLAERWRGQWALRRLETPNGSERRDSRSHTLWPAPSFASVEFSNQMAKAIQELPPGLGNTQASFSGILQEEPGKCRRGSQELLPPLTAEKPTNTWQDLMP